MRLPLLLLAAMPLFAQAPVLTTVQDTVYMADGTLGQGSIILDFPYYCTGPGGSTISVTHVQIAVFAGNFTARLAPNDTCNSTYYIATYQLSKGSQTRQQVEYWIVPTSTSPVTIDAIRTNQPTIPAYQIPLSQLAGATSPGQIPVSNGSSFIAFDRCPNGRSLISNSGTPAGQQCSPQLVNTTNGEIDFSPGWAKPWRMSNGLPPSTECSNLSQVGRVWFRMDAAAPAHSLSVCANTGVATYSWEVLGAGGGGGGGGGINDAYATITDGTNTLGATGADTLRLRFNADSIITATLTPDAPTYGDNILFSNVAGSITPSLLKAGNSVGGGFHLTIDPADITRIKYLSPSEVRANIGAASALHGATHLPGGSDSIASLTPAPNAIPASDSTGKISLGWLKLDGNPTNWPTMHWPETYFNVFKVVTGPTEIPLAEQHIAGAVEGIKSLLDIPSSAVTTNPDITEYHGAAIAGYGRSASPDFNPVGIYGQGYAAADNVTNAWGGNFLAENKGHSGMGALFSTEFNVNLTLPVSGAAPRYAFGSWVRGASNAQASLFSAAHMVQPLGAYVTPVVPWMAGFASAPGASNIGLWLDTLNGSGTSQSQSIALYDLDPLGAPHANVIYSNLGQLVHETDTGYMFKAVAGAGGTTVRLQSTNATSYTGIHFLGPTGSTTILAHIGYGNTSAPNTAYRDKFYLGSVAAKDVLFTSTDTARGVLTAGGKWGFGTTTPTTSGTGIGHFSGNTIRLWDVARTPASQTETSYLGEMAHDPNYLYVATGNNFWKKIPLIDFSSTGGGITGVPPDDNVVPVGNGTAFQPKAMPNCPTNALGYSDATNTFVCNVMSGGGTGVPTASFPFTTASGTTITFDNSTHGCGHGNIITTIEEQISSTDYRTMPLEASKNPNSPYTITYTLASPRNGRVVYSCWGGTGAGITDGDKGDVVVSGSGATLTVESAATNFNVNPSNTGTPNLRIGHATGTGNYADLLFGASGLTGIRGFATDQILRFYVNGANIYQVTSSDVSYNQPTYFGSSATLTTNSLYWRGATTGSSGVNLIGVNGSNQISIAPDAQATVVGGSLTAPSLIASSILRLPNSGSLPGTCTTGDIYLNGGSTSGQRIYGCEATNTWVKQGDGVGAAGGGISSLGGQTGSTQSFTRGAGIGGSSSLDNHSFNTDSSEADFLANGALTCGAGTRGKMQVHTTPIQYCDASATPTLRYSAYGDSAGIATSAATLSTTLGIALGGTGQTTQTAAFDALSPNTTRGDIAVRGASNNVRLAKGSQYQVLTGGATDLTWGAVALDQATAVSGILGSANGGNGNGFVAVTGPATTTKTFTLPNASATILTTNAAVTVGQGGTGLTAGTSGGIPYFSSTSAMTSSALLGANQLMLGGGAGVAPATLGSLGTTTTLLHGNAAGAPTFGAVSLTADVSGILGAANGGTGNGFFAVSGPATSTRTFTFPNASANVLTDSAAVTVAQGGTGLSSGTSGGVPYFSSTSALTSSAALAASTIVMGGGAGAAPTTGAGYTVATAGSAGTATSNAGTSTALARNDHQHKVIWARGFNFEATPSTGEVNSLLRAPAQCGGAISVETVVVTARTRGTAFTFNVTKYANSTSLASGANLFASTQTFNTSGNLSQEFTPGQNNTGLNTTDIFAINVVSATAITDFNVVLEGLCYNK